MEGPLRGIERVHVLRLPMKCPECNAKTLVKQTRKGVKRQRECFNGHRFWTEEIWTATRSAGRQTVGLTGQALDLPRFSGVTSVFNVAPQPDESRSGAAE